MNRKNWERFKDVTLSEAHKAYKEVSPDGYLTFGAWLDLDWADAPADDAQEKPVGVSNADGQVGPAPDKPRTTEDVMRGLGGLLGAGLGLALANNRGELPNVTVYVTCNGK